MQHKHIILLLDLDINSTQKYNLSAENAAIQMAFDYFILSQQNCH